MAAGAGQLVCFSQRVRWVELPKMLGSLDLNAVLEQASHFAGAECSGMTMLVAARA
jgi:hypothetical protein